MLTGSRPKRVLSIKAGYINRPWFIPGVFVPNESIPTILTKRTLNGVSELLI